MGGTGMVYDVRSNAHRSLSEEHVETPLRTKFIAAQLEDTGVAQMCKKVPARPAADDELLLVHTEQYLKIIKETQSGKQLSKLVHDIDMFSCKESETAARVSCGGLIELTKKVADGELHNGFAVIRPPGHHSNPAVPSGFCLYSNVAIAARAAQRDCGMKKILIFDWDVHHGNGTEWVFYDDPSVLVISVHGHGMGKSHGVRSALKRELGEMEAHEREQACKRQCVAKSMSPANSDDEEACDWFASLGLYEDPNSNNSTDAGSTETNASTPEQPTGVCNEVSSNTFYPGTGFSERIGIGKGLGYNVNIPWPCDGFGDVEYKRVVDDIVMPMGKEFKPDLVIISAGFDAALGDKLGGMRVTPSGFAQMTETLAGLAGGKIVAALEGGYTTEVIACCAESVVRSLLRLSGERNPDAGSLCLRDQCTETLNTVVGHHKKYWKCLNNKG